MDWKAIASGAAGAARGYEAAQGRQIPGGQPGTGLLGMLYKRHKRPPYQPGAPGTPGQPDLSGIQAPEANGTPSVPQLPIGLGSGGALPYPPQYDDQDRMAEGGIVSSPRTVMLGEDGPEMVVPLSGQHAKISPMNARPRMQYGRR